MSLSVCQICKNSGICLYKHIFLNFDNLLMMNLKADSLADYSVRVRICVGL